jgi:glycerol-3-phosphate dehydrogenase
LAASKATSIGQANNVLGQFHFVVKGQSAGFTGDFATSPFVPRQAVLVSATKGLEQDSLLRISEVIAQELRGARPVAVLSGPSFAEEAVSGLPTAVSIATADAALGQVLIDFLSIPSFERAQRV